MGLLRYFESPNDEKPRWIRPTRSIPTFWRRCTAPIQRSRSGFIGFLTSTGMSTPRRASAISCTLKGLTVVRAPIQSRSTPNSSAPSTCLALATSVAMGRPVSFLASAIHERPGSPTPSKVPGLVRGFQIPARSTSTTPVAARRRQVSRVCSSVSALHGPEIISGRLPFKSNFLVSMYVGFYYSQFQFLPPSGNHTRGIGLCCTVRSSIPTVTIHDHICGHARFAADRVNG